MPVRPQPARFAAAFSRIASSLLALTACSGGDDSVLPTSIEAGGSIDGARSDARADAGRDAPIDGTLEASDDSAAETGGDGGQDGGGAPSAVLSSTAVDFGNVNCGAPAVSRTLTITNGGGGTLVVSASVLGDAFTATPSSLSLGPGDAGAITLTASVPRTATAGATRVGSLALFLNDATGPNRVLPISATPSGATLTGAPLYAFASTEIGVPAPPVAFSVTNTGTSTAVLTLAPPANAAFTIDDLPDAGVTLQAGDTYASTAFFTPSTGSQAMTTLDLSPGGWICGASLSAIAFQGQGSHGALQGWPGGAVDFGPAPCGGSAPAPQTLTLTNSGLTDVRITSVDTSGTGGFGTSAAAGQRIPSGGSLTLTFTAPAVPATSSLAPVTGHIVIHTDADSGNAGTTIALTEEPQGAVLAWGSPAAGGCGPLDPQFGTFEGQPLLLQSSAPQSFCVVNSGNVGAEVTVTAAETGASPDGGAADPFSVSTATFTVPSASGPTPGLQQDRIAFAPQHANATDGALALAVSASTPLCASAPSPLPLAGGATGGSPTVQPPSLTFGATCGGAAPSPQTFVVRNDGSVGFTWSLSPIEGAGASLYSLSASPAPGYLAPGSIATVTVSAAAVPSPAPNPAPSAFAGQVSVLTDVPLDPPHVVNLDEIPLGDQIAVSVAGLRFGGVPIGTPLSQTFVVSNNANAGSPPASVALQTVSGVAGAAAAYTLAPLVAGPIQPGGSQTETLTFQASSPGSYPASLKLSTTDALCSSLTPFVGLRGAGTNGQLSLSSSSLAFGSDPTDPNGLVNCGSTGFAHALTVSNVGNQSLHITGLSLAKASHSPFVLTGDALTLPFALGIGASTTLVVSPLPIPSAVADPNDASAYSDVLTVTTDATGDGPHGVTLTQQPRGAVIASTPVVASWAFGTVGPGSVGTFTTAIQNTGNAPATLSLKNLSLPNVFGLQGSPLQVAPRSVTPVVGQFTPSSANGTWEDHGVLEVDPVGAFCAPLPSQWVTPALDLTGASNASPVVSLSGSLVFPSTDCGGSLPGGQSVKLTNSTNRAYAYTAKLGSGAFYTLTDGGGGTLPASGSATLVVNPKSVKPGQGVAPGSALYADNLVLSVATSPGTAFTVPISWTLTGAVLSLPQGGGPYTDGQSNPFYVADGTGSLTLPMDNGGSASASVSIGVQPAGAFEIQPDTPITVLPSVRALPTLLNTGATPSCPTSLVGTATFIYSGPVCQPFAQSSVTIHSCAGAY